MPRLRDAYAALDAAATYDEWLAAAEERDRLTGADAWREDEESAHYDARAVRRSIRRLRGLRETGDGLALAETLTEEFYRHLNALVSPALYATALSGTKRLVERYLDEAETAMRWLVTAPVRGLDARDKLRRFEAAWRVYGRSALMLSGGGTWGFHHLGVVKALHEHGLLPRILTGASTGAMVAAGVCTRTDAELTQLFADTSQIELDALIPVGLRRALRERAWLDPEAIDRVLRHNIGEWTFAEAHARTGRTLNISVSPVRARQKPRLLTHLTAPDAVIVPACRASCALPGLYRPVQLVQRGPDGTEVPYLSGERWVDGSLYGDLPKLRLARLHNVNHFIASQTNPHVLPLVRHHGQRGLRATVAGLVGAAVRTQGTFATDLFRRASRQSTGAWGRLADQAHSMVTQEYRGDIDLHPQLQVRLARKVLSNPTREDLVLFIEAGERSVWPALALIRNQTRIGRVFEECVRALRREVACES